jgi:hypothetical protein
MRADVKRWWHAGGPEDPEHCRVEMQAEIGPVGVKGGDTFNFEVCTPSALASRLDADGRPYWARGTLIVRSFARESVEAALNQYVRSVEGDDWAELAAKLNRFMRWEFEDYDG